MSRNYKIFDWNTVADAFSQCHFISIFQLAAKSYATGYCCYFYRMQLKFFADIINGSIALYGWAECKNDFLNILF